MRQTVWRLRQRMRSSLNVRQNVSFKFSGRCAVCSGKNFSRFSNRVVSGLPFNFQTCRDCGFIFVLPPSNPAAIYEEQTIPDWEFVEWNDHYLHLINQHTNVKGKLLEIGFGTASFLKLAHDDGWEVYGAELSTPQVNHARETLKLPTLYLEPLKKLVTQIISLTLLPALTFLSTCPIRELHLARSEEFSSPMEC